jgi:glutamyl-tRNA synthetase
VERLVDSGHAYRCFCTSERLKEVRAARQEAGEATGYDRRCRSLDPDDAARRAAAGEPHTVRLAVPLEGQTRFTDGVRGEIVIENRQTDDQVLLKSDGFPTYHLANVVDDHLMRISDVIRAEEWIVSTPKHVLLYEAFGWEPPRYYHVPLIRNPDRSKLSKRKNPTNVLWYRAEGYLPEAVVNFLGMLGHSMPEGQEVFTREEFRDAFTWDRVTTTGPVFDMEKFAWLNGVWIRRLSPEDLLARLRAGGFVPEGLQQKYDEAGLREIVVLVQERLRKLSEFADSVAFFVGPLDYDADLLIPTKGKKRKPTRTPGETLEALERIRETLTAMDTWDAGAMEARFRALADEMEWKVGELFTVLRVAVTCRTVSTPLFETMAVLGREEGLARLDAAVEKARVAA